MATDVKYSGSNSEESEEMFEFYCTLCYKGGNTVEAVKQCYDCCEFLCRKCIRFHNRFSTMSGHSVVDKKEMRNVPSWKPKMPLPVQTCSDHHGERITTYCADHDVICCNTCVDISHKNCDGITFIVDVAQGIKSGSQLKSTKAKLTTTLNGLKKEMVTRQTYMATLDNDRTANMQQVKDLTERLIKRIRELEEITINQIDSHHKEQSEKADKDITHLDGAISVMMENLKNLDQSQQNSESTVFVDVRLGQRHEAEGQKILQHVSAHRKTSPKFVPKSNFDSFLTDISSPGTLLDDNKIYTAKLKGNYNVKIQQDTDTCNCTGSCLLSDGTVVVTDWQHNRLKRLDTSYRVTDHCDMPSEPWGVTCTVADEVAVTLTHLKNVQFVSVRDSMSMTRSFSTSDKCRGICYNAGELFVSCGGLTLKDLEEGPGHVIVYSLNGAHLRTIHTDPSGQQIFSTPLHIAASPDDAKIYVAQMKGGVVLSDRNGKRACSFIDLSLKKAVGVCVLDNGHILVCDRESHNVIQFDSDGRKLTEILNDTDGIKRPKSMCHAGSRLIVTMDKSNSIRVFHLM